MIGSVSAVTLATHNMSRAVAFYRMLGLRSFMVAMTPRLQVFGLWGWDKMQVGRRLSFWERRGVITRKRNTIAVVDGVSAVDVLGPRPAARPKAAPRPALVRERESFSLPIPVSLPPIHERC
jgi:hypothetical protein